MGVLYALMTIIALFIGALTLGFMAIVLFDFTILLINGLRKIIDI